MNKTGMKKEEQKKEVSSRKRPVPRKGYSWLAFLVVVALLLALNFVNYEVIRMGLLVAAQTRSGVPPPEFWFILGTTLMAMLLILATGLVEWLSLSRPEILSPPVSGKAAGTKETGPAPSGPAEELKARKGKEDFFFERSQTYNIIIDPNGRILDLNQTFLNLVNRTKKELIGREPEELALSSHRERFKKYLARHLEDGLTSSLEISFPAGEYVRTILFGENHQVLKKEHLTAGVLLSGIDITPLHRLQQESSELRRKVAQSARMENLGLLAGGVAHDLKNLFSPILAYPDFIGEKLPAESDLRRPLAMIKKSALRASEVIQNFLTMARRGKYKLETMDVNQMLEDYSASPDFQELAERYPEVKITLELAPSLSLVRGLPSQLMNVVMNLVRNGCEATPAEGTLKISTRAEKLDFPRKGFQQIPRGEYVIIKVIDQGKGIDPENLKKIFTPFTSGKKMGRSGSGLGLAVVLGVVEDHQGHLDVSSEVGRGTTFSIYLPAVISGGQDRTSLDQPAVALLVDDDELDRRQMAKLLSEMKYQVISMSGGKEAITYAGNHQVDLLITDISLQEGENGLDVCRRIFEVNPPKQALVISGSLTAEKREEAARMGIGCLEKPLSREKLIPFLPRSSAG